MTRQVPVPSRWAVPLVLVVVVVALGACGNDEGTASTETSVPPTETSTTTEPATTASGAPPAGTAPCSEETFLPVVSVLTEGLEEEVAITSVSVEQCQNGYARVLAIPDSPGYEVEQLFLKDVGGTWEIIDYGTGIECTATGLAPETEEACVALGLS